jgi:tripartite-type tricarboxylate transporter receptor subunit TctC
LGFEPVSVLTQIPLALVVRPDFLAANAMEFIAYAKPIRAN